LRRILIAVLLCCCAAWFAGPLSSGALLLLLPAGAAPIDHRLPESYDPLHKGHVDLATGLYIREDEDLIVREVRGAPPLVLRRTYLSNYHVSKQFGIGATHDGELYLIGDGARFQYASLILAAGTRINFARVSPGTSFWNAMYEHRESIGEWQGARLGWTGVSWALREMDGSLSVFKGCDGPTDSCSILKTRDADGHSITYRRNSQGRLARMEAGAAWIAFDYDAEDRITRAYDSTEHQVRYEYDGSKRLSRVIGDEGTVRRYTYTAADQMATVIEPETDIENFYDAGGRCVRQINRFPDASPYVFDFTYRVDNGRVVQVDTTESGGKWSSYTLSDGYTTMETSGRNGLQPAVFTYERDARTKAVSALTVTCPDRTGRPLRHSSVVTDGDEERVKWDLLQTHCDWRRAGAATPAVR
jgi:YD repeat-containing protein